MGRSSSPAAAVASYQQPDSLPDMYNNLHQSEDMSDINYADPDFDLYSSNMAAAESADPEDFPAFSGDIDDDFYNSHYGAMENNEDDLDNDIVGFANEANDNDKNKDGLNGKNDKMPKSKS